MKAPYFFIFIPLLFFLDIFCCAFFEQWLVYALLCFYVFLLSQSNKSIAAHLATIVVLSLEAFVHYGHVGIQLLYLIPLTFLGILIQRSFYVAWLHPYLLLVIGLLAQALVVEAYLLRLETPIFYTMKIISVNIVLMIGISLTCKFIGNQGNR